MWFIGVEVEQETSAPPPEKNPGSAPDICQVNKGSVLQIMKTDQTPERLYNLKIVPIFNTRRVSSVGRVSTYPTEFFKRDKDY